MTADELVPIIICPRITESRPRIAGSVIRHCTACFAAVWKGPSAINVAGRVAAALCIQCFGATPENNGEILGLTFAQIKEMRAHRVTHAVPP